MLTKKKYDFQYFRITIKATYKNLILDYLWLYKITSTLAEKNISKLKIKQ